MSETSDRWIALNDAMVDHAANAQLHGVPFRAWLGELLFDGMEAWAKVEEAMEKVDEDNLERMLDEAEEEEEEEES